MKKREAFQFDIYLFIYSVLENFYVGETIFMIIFFLIEKKKNHKNCFRLNFIKFRRAVLEDSRHLPTFSYLLHKKEKLYNRYLYDTLLFYVMYCIPRTRKCNVGWTETRWRED